MQVMDKDKYKDNDKGVHQVHQPRTPYRPTGHAATERQGKDVVKCLVGTIFANDSSSSILCYTHFKIS